MSFLFVDQPYGSVAYVNASNTFVGNQAITGKVLVGTTISNGIGILQVVDNSNGNADATLLRLSGIDNTYGFDFVRSVSTGALSIQGNQTGFNNLALVPTSGNVSFGSDTDNGSKVQVTGNATLSHLKTTVTAPAPTGLTKMVTTDENGLLSFQSIPAGGSGAIAVFSETPTGLVNGSNATYTTAFNFDPTSVEVFINGLRQKRITHFTTSGLTTIILYDSPQTNDLLQVNYERA